MKTKIILALTLTVLSFTSLLAQKKTVHKAVVTPKTAAPKATTQSKTTTAATAAKAYNTKESITCSVSTIPGGCMLVFRNSSSSLVTDIVEKQKDVQSLIIKKYLVGPNNSIRDLTSVEYGKDKMQVKPVIQSAVLSIEDENTNSSSPNADSAAVNDVHFLISINGNKKELKGSDGEFNLPADLADGSYLATLTWDSRNSESVSFLMNFKGGRFLDINENKLTENKTIAKELVKTKTTTVKKTVKKEVK